MTEGDPALDTFVARPRAQFVDQPRTEAVRRGPAEPPPGARISDAQPTGGNDQRLAQSPSNPGQHGALPAPALVHRGRIGQTGTVSVTTGEAVSGLDANGVREFRSGLIGFQYSDPSPGGANRVLHSHWLQFVYTELLCGTQSRLFNVVGVAYVNGAPIPLYSGAGPPAWRVDTLPPSGLGTSRAIIPWYDYSAQTSANRGGGLAIRTPTSLTIFDGPGPAEGVGALSFVQSILGDPINQARIGARQTATSALLAFHFHTYLIQGSRPSYDVSWTAGFSITDLDRPGAAQSSPRIYTIGPSSGPVSRLPRHHFVALVRDFPAYANIAHQ